MTRHLMTSLMTVLLIMREKENEAELNYFTRLSAYGSTKINDGKVPVSALFLYFPVNPNSKECLRSNKRCLDHKHANCQTGLNRDVVHKMLPPGILCSTA